MGILAAGQRRGPARPWPASNVDAEQHLEVEAVALALGDELGQPARHAPDLLEMARRGRKVHDRPVLRVGHGDDRRHDAGPVAEALEDAERPLEDLRRLDEQRADRRLARISVSMSAPDATRRQELVRAAGQDLAGEPRAPPREVDHPDLAKGGGEAAIVAELLRELDRPAIGLLGAVEVDLDRGAAERLAQRAPQQRLAELEGRPELRWRRRPVPARGSRTRRASSAAASSSWLIRSADARRSWTSSSIAGSRIASARAASSVRPSSRSPVRRRAAIRVVAGREQGLPVGRRSRPPGVPARRGGVPPRGRSRRGPPSRHRSRTRRADRVAGRERVLGEHRQAGGSRVATVEQQVDDRGVDLPATGRRELVRGELADLLVGERVVGGLALGPAGAGGPPRRRARGRRRAGRTSPELEVRRPVSQPRSGAISPSPTRAGSPEGREG